MINFYIRALMQWYQRYKNDFRLNLKLASPIIAGQVGQLTVSIADNVMVGSLGAASLAAISFSIAIFMLFLIVGFGISFGLPPLIAEAKASHHYKRISEYFKHSLIINIIFGIVSLILLLSIIPFMDYMGQDEEVLVLAKPYLTITAISIIPVMIFQTFRTYADGMSETLPPMIAILIGNVLNIFLNYALIFGKYGAPKMGVTGAGYATLITRIVIVGILIVLCFKWKNLWKHIVGSRFSRYSKQVFSKILNLSIPTSLQAFFEMSIFSFASIMMGLISKEAQAAHQIAINLAAITFLICSGLAMAATIRVGDHFGKKDVVGLQRSANSAVIQVTFFMTLCALIFIVFKNQLPLLYIDNMSVTTIASTLIILAAVFQLPDGIQVTTLGALRGIQDVKIPTLITFVAYFIIGFPTCYIFAFLLDFGPVGIWVGLVTSLSISAILLQLRFRKLSKGVLKNDSSSGGVPYI